MHRYWTPPERPTRRRAGRTRRPCRAGRTSRRRSWPPWPSRLASGSAGRAPGAASRRAGAAALAADRAAELAAAVPTRADQAAELAAAVPAAVPTRADQAAAPTPADPVAGRGGLGSDTPGKGRSLGRPSGRAAPRSRTWGSSWRDATAIPSWPLAPCGPRPSPGQAVRRSAATRGQPGAWRRQGAASSICAASASSCCSLPGGPTIWAAAGSPSGRVPTGTTTAGKPATFQAETYGANLAQASMLALQDRADHGSAAGGAAASAGVTSASYPWSANQSTQRCRQAARSSSRTRTRRIAAPPRAMTRRLRGWSISTSSPAASASRCTAAHQVATPLTANRVGYAGSARTASCPAPTSSRAAVIALWRAGLSGRTPGEHREPRRGVPDGRRQDPVLVHPEPVVGAQVARYDPASRLDADQPAGGGRNAYRPEPIGAVGDRHQTGRDRRGGAAR